MHNCYIDSGGLYCFWRWKFKATLINRIHLMIATQTNPQRWNDWETYRDNGCTFDRARGRERVREKKWLK